MGKGGNGKCQHSLQPKVGTPSGRGRWGEASGRRPNPKSRRGTGKPVRRIPNPEDAQGPPPLSRVDIKKGARTALREAFEKAMADPSSDAYRMLEIMCLNELIEAEVKTREMDALEVFRARNQGKELEAKIARVQSQNMVAEAQTEKLRLQIRALEDTMARIREKALQASEAKKQGRPFDYDRALKQISAVIGVGRGEEFLHDEQEAEAQANRP